nr:immunoglobulin heavy chain junction region [Mus musculus]
CARRGPYGIFAYW